MRNITFNSFKKAHINTIHIYIYNHKQRRLVAFTGTISVTGLFTTVLLVFNCSTRTKPSFLGKHWLCFSWNWFIFQKSGSKLSSFNGTKKPGRRLSVDYFHLPRSCKLCRYVFDQREQTCWRIRCSCCHLESLFNFKSYIVDSWNAIIRLPMRLHMDVK